MDARVFVCALGCSGLAPASLYIPVAKVHMGDI